LIFQEDTLNTQRPTLNTQLRTCQKIVANPAQFMNTCRKKTAGGKFEKALNIRSESDILSYKEKGETSSKNYI